MLGIPFEVYGTTVVKLVRTKLSGEAWIAGSSDDSKWITKTLVVCNINEKMLVSKPTQAALRLRIPEAPGPGHGQDPGGPTGSLSGGPTVSLMERQELSVSQRPGKRGH